MDQVQDLVQRRRRRGSADTPVVWTPPPCVNFLFESFRFLWKSSDWNPPSEPAGAEHYGLVLARQKLICCYFYPQENKYSKWQLFRHFDLDRSY